jgi:hypothetical protein
MRLYQLHEMDCPICGLCVCKCDVEQEEVQYKGKSITIGKHDDKTDGHYDPHELAMGIEVEKEHTNDERIAKCIAKDHLSELPDYYSRLKRMQHMKEGVNTFKAWLNNGK